MDHVRKAIVLLFFVLFVSSCTQKIDEKELVKLNGYWAIEKVVFPDKTQKEYPIGQIYDYIELDKNHTGFRKKVTLQLDGTFLVDDQSEKLTVKEEDHKTFLYCETPYSSWKEQLMAVSDRELSITNAEGKTYTYKKILISDSSTNGKTE